MIDLNSLTAVSPIDGRYSSKTSSLKDYFSEKYPGVSLSKRDMEENRLEIYERNGGSTS